MKEPIPPPDPELEKHRARLRVERRLAKQHAREIAISNRG